MIKYNDKQIAAVGKYLVASNNMRGYAIQIQDGVTFEEKDLSDACESRPDGSVSYGGVFNINPGANLKKRLICQIFSNDDQIAIILNKDDGDDEHEVMYQFMQDWRAYFGSLAKKINETAGL